MPHLSVWCRTVNNDNDFNDFPEIVLTREIAATREKTFLVFSSVAVAYILNGPIAAASIAPTPVRQCGAYNSGFNSWSERLVAAARAQLQSAELKYKRLIEQFKKTSQELRDVVYQCLGFRVDMPTTGQYRLMNVYAESANDYFLFTVSIDGRSSRFPLRYL